MRRGVASRLSRKPTGLSQGTSQRESRCVASRCGDAARRTRRLRGAAESELRQLRAAQACSKVPKQRKRCFGAGSLRPRQKHLPEASPSVQGPALALRGPRAAFASSHAAPAVLGLGAGGSGDRSSESPELCELCETGDKASAWRGDSALLRLPKWSWQSCWQRRMRQAAQSMAKLRCPLSSCSELGSQGPSECTPRKCTAGVALSRLITCRGVLTEVLTSNLTEKEGERGREGYVFETLSRKTLLLNLKVSDPEADLLSLNSPKRFGFFGSNRCNADCMLMIWCSDTAAFDAHGCSVALMTHVPFCDSCVCVLWPMKFPALCHCCGTCCRYSACCRPRVCSSALCSSGF